ncbi:MAG: segregation and condensation protein A, partial [Polyangiaceae bacterium]
IKSKMLLPAPPPGQEDDALLEEEDPREALIRRLLEYQKYKQAAADLTARGVTGRDVFMRGVEIEEAVPEGLPPLAEVPLFSLLEAFQAVLSRAKIEISHDVVADRISITDRIHELTEIFAARKQVAFDELFSGVMTKFDLVITFLALLEMSRLKMMRMTQTGPLAPLYIAVRESEEGSEENAAPEGLP